MNNLIFGKNGLARIPAVAYAGNLINAMNQKIKNMFNKKTNKRKKLFNFTAIFEPAEEGGYVVYIPALPGCATQGETFEEAEAMAKDAIEGYLQTLNDLKKEIPLEPGRMIISKIPAIVSF